MSPLLLTLLFLAADDLPKGEDVLAKYLEVTGGRAAHASVQSSVAVGKIEMPAQGIKGTITIYESQPNRQYSIAEIPGIGTMEDGTDGVIAWSKSVLQGARLKEGDEKAAAIRSANAESKFINWKKLYKSVETTGTDDIDGKPCYKVVLTPFEGKPETEYYDKASGLLMKESMVVASPMGEVPVETAVSDYRKEGAILMPHKLKQSAIGQQFTITIESVKINPDLPKDRFDAPAEVKALLKK